LLPLPLLLLVVFTGGLLANCRRIQVSTLSHICNTLFVAAWRASLEKAVFTCLLLLPSTVTPKAHEFKQQKHFSSITKLRVSCVLDFAAAWTISGYSCSR
jgi:hypothetical protein